MASAKSSDFLYVTQAHIKAGKNRKAKPPKRRGHRYGVDKVKTGIKGNQPIFVPPGWFTIRDVADYLGVTPTTVAKAVVRLKLVKRVRGRREYEPLPPSKARLLLQYMLLKQSGALKKASLRG